MENDKTILKCCLVISLLLTGVLVANGQVLRVAVAANAQFVANKLEKAFEKKHPVKIDIIVGSSGKLTAQITHGAPYDIFLSADMSYPEKLYQAGLTLNKPSVYAYGSLVLWTLQNTDLKKGIKALKSPAITTIAIANPTTAPYGVASVDAMKKAGVYLMVKNKIVYGESIAQVNQYLTSGVADIAFTAKSVVKAPGLKNKGYWIDLPDSLYQPIKQGVVLLKQAKKDNLAAAKQFYRFLFSPLGKSIFKSYGYIIK